MEIQIIFLLIEEYSKENKNDKRPKKRNYQTRIFLGIFLTFNKVSLMNPFILKIDNDLVCSQHPYQMQLVRLTTSNRNRVIFGFRLEYINKFLVIA